VRGVEMNMTHADQFFERSRQFIARAEQLGLADAARYYWYHTVDLGDGLITPGMYDYRETISSFQFPEDMRGMTVLDVGSATGFFAFEFERRGARVISVELPSLRDLDRFPGQDVDSSLRKIERMIFPDTVDQDKFVRHGHSERDLYWYLLEGPFRFCRERLGSRIERCYSTVYDLTLERTGVREGFDLVFFGDVLIHTLYPLKALAALAGLCKGTLVFAGVLPDGPQEPPAMVYIGGSDAADDEVAWWHPNLSCLTRMLSKLGFAQVEKVGFHRGLLNPSGWEFERVILRAKKRLP
jgi:tRNA (mo5U34)-methyltransferase